MSQLSPLPPPPPDSDPEKGLVSHHVTTTTTNTPPSSHNETSAEGVTSATAVTEKKSHGAAMIDELSEVEASRGWFASFVKRSAEAHSESRGIERVREEDRDTKASVFDGYTMWASANLTPVTFAAGTLGSGFGLSFAETCAVLIPVNLLTCLLIGYFGCLGPMTGLRMMSIGRFALGVWGSRALMVLGGCALLGWASVNSIAGAQILTELSDGRFPLWAGNLLIGVISAVISFFGYFVIHFFERYCWAPMLLFFCFMAGYGAEWFDVSARPLGLDGEPVMAASPQGVVTFIAVTYSFIAAWSPIVADYYVRMPHTVSKPKLTFAIGAGQFLGMVIPQVLGAAFMTSFLKNPAYADAFARLGPGGLMVQVLVPPLGGFGRFLLVMAGLMGIIGSNLVNNYSLAFTVQNLHPSLLKVPRPLWTLLASAVIIAIAIAGSGSFADFLVSFLSVTGYYTTPFMLCVLVDLFYFRRREGGYPLESWNDMSVIGPGFAGLAALAMGFVGAVLSMNQTWYVGVVAKAAGGDQGGVELGWIFSGVFSVLAYMPLRHLEIRYMDRRRKSALSG